MKTEREVIQAPVDGTNSNPVRAHRKLQAPLVLQKCVPIRTKNVKLSLSLILSLPLLGDECLNKKTRSLMEVIWGVVVVGKSWAVVGRGIDRAWLLVGVTF